MKKDKSLTYFYLKAYKLLSKSLYEMNKLLSKINFNSLFSDVKSPAGF